MSGHQAYVKVLTELAHSAVARWQLQRPQLRLVNYRENAVFCVSVAGQAAYSLKIHRFGYHSDINLASEHQWMTGLAQSGVAVPQVIQLPDGETFCHAYHPDLSQPRQVDLQTWIDAPSLGGANRETLTAQRGNEVLVQLGRLQAKLHQHAESWEPPAGFSRHAWDRDGLVGESPFWGRFSDLDALSRDQLDLLTVARDELRVDLANFTTDRSAYGVIHADLNPDNILVKADKCYLIDFDDTGYGWYLFDIATTMFSYVGSKKYTEFLADLIDGYRSVRPLSDDDLRHLPMFLVARGLSLVGWLHTRGETDTAEKHTSWIVQQTCRLAEQYLAGTNKVRKESEVDLRG